jgi:hypothetical protein
VDHFNIPQRVHFARRGVPAEPPTLGAKPSESAQKGALKNCRNILENVIAAVILSPTTALEISLEKNDAT